MGPVCFSLEETGRVSLLTAPQEGALGRRIETGQSQLRGALGDVRMAVETLLTLMDGVRHTEVPLDDVILLPEGGEPEPEQLKPIVASFGRIRRLEREIP